MLETTIFSPSTSNLKCFGNHSFEPQHVQPLETIVFEGVPQLVKQIGPQSMNQLGRENASDRNPSG